MHLRRVRIARHVVDQLQVDDREVLALTKADHHGDEDVRLPEAGVVEGGVGCPVAVGVEKDVELGDTRRRAPRRPGGHAEVRGRTALRIQRVGHQSRIAGEAEVPEVR